MATYDNQYSMKITPNTPNLRGISSTYDNTGTNKVSNTGLGQLYELDYDRNKIESIFNEGTDAQYALMQKENQIAQNQYANNQFANQQSALNTLRAQRNEQIASGMARGLNAAQEQGTVLGLQQESAAGALELANQQQLEADKIAAEYAANVSKALQEANSVKQAMAQVAAQMYEADMLGYTGELSANAQMDANASDRYGYDLGLEGTKYTADLGYKGTVYNADQNLAGTKYAADLGLEGTKYAADKNYSATVNAANIQAAATKAAAATTAAATKYAAQLQSKGVDYQSMVAKNTNADGTVNWAGLKGDLVGNGLSSTDADAIIAGTKSNTTSIKNGITALNQGNASTWIKALDGNNNALSTLGVDIFGQKKSNVNNTDAKNAVNEAMRQISSGEYNFTTSQQLMDDLKNHKFGYLSWGF